MMTLTITLSPETEARLNAEAARRGEQPADVVRRLIENYFADTVSGADAIAFWKRHNVLGTFADRPEDSQELAKKLRQEAQRAKSPQEQAAELRAMFDEWA